MACLRTLLVLLLINVTAFGQCVVNSTEPPQFYSSGLPVAWPKTNVYSAPTYVGHVEYFVYCGYIQDQNGNDYWSCPSAALNNDIDTAIGNWDAASDSNGSTVHFVFVSQRPEDPGTCGPTPCFPTRTPYIEFLQQRHDDLIAAHPGVIAFTPTDWTDYGCQSPLCPYQVGPYYRNALATVVFSDHITNDH